MENLQINSKSGASESPNGCRVQGLLWLGFSLLSTGVLTGVRVFTHATVTYLDVIGGGVFSAALLFPFTGRRSRSSEHPATLYTWINILLIGMGHLVLLIFVLTGATWAAWGTLWIFYRLLLELGVRWTNTSLWQRWIAYLFLAALSGSLPVIVTQVQTHFSEEEFFVALQALELGVYWALLLWGRTQIARVEINCTSHVQTNPRRSLRLPWWLIAMGGLAGFFGALGVVVAYQHSFYPVCAPPYPKVGYDAPFLCGEAAPLPETVDGEDIFYRLLARVEANPNKNPPEYGMLALGAGKEQWAIAFRDSLLAEAVAQRFTDPAHSVKWFQYAAALRVYYFARVNAAFEGLFSPADLTILQAWFANINRRALTVEWVDWLYSLALADWPRGPYENQENGAGLLALLEVTGLAAPELSSANRDYLSHTPRGWAARFRNTDDTFSYQLEWINNAYFQSLYTGEYSETAQQLSFEWLLLQALPDGRPLKYNHPDARSLAGTAYLGAQVLTDPHYLWLAEQAIEKLEAEGGYLSAQPGVEAPLAMRGLPPTQGSCLLYGDSGLPNQAGPLAPDKIVFRDGWDANAAYLLLNLRFTGWHRYKATNTISLVYQEGTIATELLTSNTFAWLPKGRSLFRDKRIPRESLNGLLVERTGMIAVVNQLTGTGGPWAQDPPYYAEVVAFQPGAEMDWSHTRLSKWHGWQHNRWVYFYHKQGPIVVVDEAIGPPHRAALVWHLATDTEYNGAIQLKQPQTEARLLSWPEAAIRMTPDTTTGYSRIVVEPLDKTGQLHVATVFLRGRWHGAETWVDATGHTLSIAKDDEMIILPLPTTD